MSLNKCMFSSASCEWETPIDLFAALDREFGFQTDVCATNENAKCKQYFTKAEDGLAQTWNGVCWMNPPYGREIGKWVEKAYNSAKQGATVVCLLPARTDTRWWHDYCMNGEIRFVRGRLKFGGARNGAPFPSAVVIFNGDDENIGERYDRIQAHGLDYPAVAAPDSDQSAAHGMGHLRRDKAAETEHKIG